MSEISNLEKKLQFHEIDPKPKKGMVFLVLNIIMMLAALGIFIYGINLTDRSTSIGIVLIVLGALYLVIVGPLIFGGLKILKPNEALVLTLFGKYYGTLRGEGYYFVNPFASAFNPIAHAELDQTVVVEPGKAGAKNSSSANVRRPGKIISLKTMTLSNDKQKINDAMGNPIIIGIVVIWKVVNTAKAAFNVDNYKEFLSIQCDSALRNIVRLYPYDASVEEGEKSLRGSSQEVAERLKAEIQASVEIAGLVVMEARITHLAYAPEIAAAMLQRQQASAIIEARQMIVDGAVGMVEMALDKLNEHDIVHLDEERKAAMVSNLLVVLCGNKDAQPIVNSGSIY